MALKECIRARTLASVPGNAATHVPYRRSKLTLLLKVSYLSSRGSALFHLPPSESGPLNPTDGPTLWQTYAPTLVCAGFQLFPHSTDVLGRAYLLILHHTNLRSSHKPNLNHIRITPRVY